MSASEKPLTKKELRKFGLTVGGIFLVLAGISRWRGHEIPPMVLGSLGVLLFVPGLIAPSILRPVEKGWMRFAAGLAYVNTRIILTVLYYVLFAPIGLIRRMLGKDGLNLKLGKGETSDWVKREVKPVDAASYRMQF